MKLHPITALQVDLYEQNGMVPGGGSEMKCRGIEIEPLKFSGCAGDDDCPGCRGASTETPCGHEVRVQDPADERKFWRWECQRQQRHRGTHMASNGIRMFEWKTDDCVIRVSTPHVGGARYEHARE